MVREWLANVISGGALSEYKAALKGAQEDVRYQGKRAAEMWVALREIRYMRPTKNATSTEAKMAQIAADVLDNWSGK